MTLVLLGETLTGPHAECEQQSSIVADWRELINSQSSVKVLFATSIMLPVRALNLASFDLRRPPPFQAQVTA